MHGSKHAIADAQACHNSHFVLWQYRSCQATVANSTAPCCRDACILVLSNGFAVGCLVTIILHLVIPDEHDIDNPDDEIKSPEGHASFTTHGAGGHGRVPASFYNSKGGDDDDSVMKPMEMSSMSRNDDTAHPISQV